MVDEGRHTRHWGVPGVPEKKHICNLYIKDGYFRYYPNCYPFPLKKKNIFTKILKPPSHGIHQWFLQVHLLPFSARRLPLAKCILNPSCAADLTCVIACSGQPDESSCQHLGKKFGKGLFYDVFNLGNVEEERYGTCTGCEKNCTGYLVHYGKL